LRLKIGGGDISIKYRKSNLAFSSRDNLFIPQRSMRKEGNILRGHTAFQNFPLVILLSLFLFYAIFCQFLKILFIQEWPQVDNQQIQTSLSIISKAMNLWIWLLFLLKLLVKIVLSLFFFIGFFSKFLFFFKIIFKRYLKVEVEANFGNKQISEFYSSVILKLQQALSSGNSACKQTLATISSQKVGRK